MSFGTPGMASLSVGIKVVPRTITVSHLTGSRNAFKPPGRDTVRTTLPGRYLSIFEP